MRRTVTLIDVANEDYDPRVIFSVTWWSPGAYMSDGPNGITDSWVLGFGLSRHRIFARLLGLEVWFSWGRV